MLHMSFMLWTFSQKIFFLLLKITTQSMRTFLKPMICCSVMKSSLTCNNYVPNVYSSLAHVTIGFFKIGLLSIWHIYLVLATQLQLELIILDFRKFSTLFEGWKLEYHICLISKNAFPTWVCHSKVVRFAF
jgi:hypothetical protein